MERYVIDGIQTARSAICKKLVEMPRIREVRLKDHWVAENITTNRSQNVEALLGGVYPWNGASRSLY